MKIVIDMKNYNEWYIEEVVEKLKQVVSSNRIRLVKE